MKGKSFKKKLNKFVVAYLDITLIRNKFESFSIQSGIFQDKLKLSGVTTLFEGGNEWGIGDFRLMSALPRFSKMLE